MAKIAILNSVYNLGSTGRICFDLSNELIDSGFEVKVFYGRNNQNLPHSFYFGTKLDNYWHGFMTRLTGKHGLYSKSRTKMLLKELNKFNADMFVLNNLHGYYINYKILFDYLSKQNKPVIWIFHDCWPFTGHCAHFSYYGCQKWKTDCKSCPYRFTYPASFFACNSQKNFSAKKESFLKVEKLSIVCPSLWLADLVKQSFFSGKEVKVINNGINEKIFQKKKITQFRKKYGLEDKKLILCVSYVFNKRKGLSDIIEISKRLNDSERIVVVGKIKNGKIPQNIIHIERTDNVDELVDIYSSCDVLFNPTYEDNYPTVNLEAVSCSLPVVCYRTGGAPESVDSRYVVEQGDINMAYELMHSIFSNPSAYVFKKDLQLSMNYTFKQYKALIDEILLKDSE